MQNITSVDINVYIDAIGTIMHQFAKSTWESYWKYIIYYNIIYTYFISVIISLNDIKNYIFMFLVIYSDIIYLYLSIPVKL